VKVIQIIRGSDEPCHLLALCDDGSIWEYGYGKWAELEPPLRRDEEEGKKLITHALEFATIEKL
jgi:hypothetical protein